MSAVISLSTPVTKRSADFAPELRHSKSRRADGKDTFAGRTCREEALWDVSDYRSNMVRSPSVITLTSMRSTASLASMRSTASLASMRTEKGDVSVSVMEVDAFAPPPYEYPLSMKPNHRVRSQGSRQAVEICSEENSKCADRIQLPANKTKGLLPILSYEDGVPTLALSNVKPAHLMLVSMQDLRALTGYLNGTKVRVKYWDDLGNLGTKRVCAFKDNGRTVSATAALALMMQTRGSDIAAQRVMSFAPTSVRKELTRLGVKTYISSTSIREVLSDAVMHIADPQTLGTERPIASAAATAVYEYLKRNVGNNPEALRKALGTLLEATQGVQSADAVGALVGVLLSGLFMYVERVESHRRAMILGAKVAANVGIGLLEEVPGTKVAVRLLDLAVDAAAGAAMDRGAKSLREALRTFVVDNIKFPLEKTGYLPGMEEAGAKPFDEANISRFSRWLDLALEANGFGPIAGR